MPTMLEDKGAEYVAAWLRTIARQYGTHTLNVAAAIREATGQEIAMPPDSLVHDPSDVQRVIGAMTSVDTKRTLAALRAILRRGNPADRPFCHYCGQPVAASGDCEECV